MLTLCREYVFDLFNSWGKHDSDNDISTKAEMGWASSFAAALTKLGVIMSWTIDLLESICCSKALTFPTLTFVNAIYIQQKYKHNTLFFFNALQPGGSRLFSATLLHNKSRLRLTQCVLKSPVPIWCEFPLFCQKRVPRQELPQSMILPDFRHYWHNLPYTLLRASQKIPPLAICKKLAICNMPQMPCSVNSF